jgi:UDP-3-O-[3-hydroxymyristoyl] glucosamine N-acyltransferase
VSVEKHLREINEFLGGSLTGDGSVIISGIKGIKEAGEGDITFLANPKYLPFLKETKASAVIVSEEVESSPVPTIKVKDPYLGFLKVMKVFNPPQKYTAGLISPTAVVSPDATLADDVHVGEQVVIEGGVKIGNGTVIRPGCFIGEGSEIGANCLLHPRVTVMHRSKIGSNVVIHSGVVIGSDGFGFARQEGIYQKIPQAGNVVIEDQVEIGANVTIDRATMGSTVIGRGTKIDNLVQVGHNVIIGENTVIAAQVGISGSVKIGKGCTLAGQVGIAGHLEIGDNVTIAAQSGIHKSLPGGSTVLGSPAREIQKERRITAIVSRLPDMVRKIRKLEKQLGEIAKPGSVS